MADTVISSLSDFKAAGLFSFAYFEPFAHLPGQNSTKFELVVNLATAKSLGLVIPLSDLNRAHEVIE